MTPSIDGIIPKLHINNTELSTYFILYRFITVLLLLPNNIKTFFESKESSGILHIFTVALLPFLAAAGCYKPAGLAF